MRAMRTTSVGTQFPVAVALRRLEAALSALDQAEQLLERAQEMRGTDPRASFELVHRAALKGAGVVIEQANRERKRPLPLNAWTALARLGGVHREWAVSAEPMVAERARLDAGEGVQVRMDLLDAHCAATAQRLAAVRAEITLALLPGAGAVTAAR